MAHHTAAVARAEPDCFIVADLPFGTFQRGPEVAVDAAVQLVQESGAEAVKVVSRNVLSTPAEAGIPLRWVAMMSARVSCDLAASTGIHDGHAVVKQVLAGAKAVQVVSGLYKNGTSHIQTMLKEMDTWMTRQGVYGLEQLRGKMSQASSDNPAAYERVQFMRYAGGGRPV